MPVSATRTAGLTGNQLKIIAMIAMTCDHVGLQLLPQLGWLRIIGRLALPVYAYMIAEGCRYTHDRKRYLLRLAGLATVCQAVYFFAMGSLYMCILVTFSLSVCLIWTVDQARSEPRASSLSLALGTAAAVFAVCELAPRVLPGFEIDYGLLGVMLPVAVYFGRDRWQKLLFLSPILLLLASELGGIQWFSLAAIPLLALYNGQRGKYRIGTLFYLYYPLHLVVIYIISLFL